MERNNKGTGLLAVGLVGLLPAILAASKPDDFQAVLAFVAWILAGIVLVKILAIFAGVS